MAPISRIHCAFAGIINWYLPFLSISFVLSVVVVFAMKSGISRLIFLLLTMNGYEISNLKYTAGQRVYLAVSGSARFYSAWKIITMVAIGWLLSAWLVIGLDAEFMPIALDIMPLEPVAAEPPPPKSMVVRYGYLKLIGEFESNIQEKVACGSRLVARTSRGIEIVEMLTTLCANGGCNKSITRDQLLEYVKQSGGKDFPFSNNGRILRLATAPDLARQQFLDNQRVEYLKMARRMVEIHRVPMKMVEVEFLLGGEKIIFYFTSEHRVDFRSLIRDMAHQLHARIDLHQIGARDEARLVADYEKCGQHCCCKQFLKVLTPISMRSAKIQKATLDPAKISGRCGRLMCCLRYEDETYEELRKRLPPKYSRVRTAVGEGWVIDGQILTQLVLVQYDNGNQSAVPLESIKAFDLPKPLTSSGRTMQFPGDGV